MNLIPAAIAKRTFFHTRFPARRRNHLLEMSSPGGPFPGAACRSPAGASPHPAAAAQSSTRSPAFSAMRQSVCPAIESMTSPSRCHAPCTAPTRKLHLNFSCICHVYLPPLACFSPAPFAIPAVRAFWCSLLLDCSPLRSRNAVAAKHVCAKSRLTLQMWITSQNRCTYELQRRNPDLSPASNKKNSMPSLQLWPKASIGENQSMAEQGLGCRILCRKLRSDLRFPACCLHGSGWDTRGRHHRTSSNPEKVKGMSYECGIERS